MDSFFARGHGFEGEEYVVGIVDIFGLRNAYFGEKFSLGPVGVGDCAVDDTGRTNEVEWRGRFEVRTVGFVGVVGFIGGWGSRARGCGDVGVGAVVSVATGEGYGTGSVGVC